jgi:hypothetical protein
MIEQKEIEEIQLDAEEENHAVEKLVRERLPQQCHGFEDVFFEGGIRYSCSTPFL